MSGWTPSDEQRRQEGEDIPHIPPGGTRKPVGGVSGRDANHKVVKVRRWNIIRSQIRHQGFGWWLYKKAMRAVRDARAGRKPRADRRHPMSDPGKFRKKPVVIEAMQYPGLREMSDAMLVLAWLDAHGVSHTHRGGLVIQTLEGEMRADPGDWIIKGVQGEFYPCKPDIFEATYEDAS